MAFHSPKILSHQNEFNRYKALKKSGKLTCSVSQCTYKQNVFQSHIPQNLANKSARGVVACHSQEEHSEPKLGPNVLSGIKDLKDNVVWSTATVVRNDAVNLQGNTRLLHLSVEDHVDVLYGRKIKGVIDSTRWIDSYTVPGQFIALRYTSEGHVTAARQLYCIASTPYQSRRDSAYLDSSLIEIVAERGASPDDTALADLGPGAQLEVSQVIGRGFCSLLNSYVGLLTAMEAGKQILVIAACTRGMVPVRALLNWTPVLAHATRNSITCFYVSKSAASAAFLTEWDAWREAGVRFHPLYTENSLGDDFQPLSLLEEHLFIAKGGLESVIGGRASDCCVLLAGLTGQEAVSVSKQLQVKGIHHEQILYCDFF